MQKKVESDTSNATPPTDVFDVDICVIGAGSGGLSVAAASAAFGQKVVLIEKAKMGGDCLNYGCVPSKAMLAAGKRAQAMRSAEKFGIRNVEPTVDFSAVNAHVKSVIAAIQPNDSVERFTGLGVHVIQAAAKFIDKSTVVAGENRITARRFVIATGSSPFVPPIEGLDSVPYFTNETLFDNQSRIDHLIIIGGGPIGMEMAQAHRRLGSKVTVLEQGTALGNDDPEMTAVALSALRGEGVDIREHTKVIAIEGGQEHIRVKTEAAEGTEFVNGSHLLVAVGRRPNVSGLGLEAAGVTYDAKGIKTKRGQYTTNGRIFAIGDVTGGLQFTHVANDQAGIVVARALFRAPVNHDPSKVPWVTYTDPEVAHVGLTEDAAAARYGKINVLRWPYHENDRAQAERVTHGHAKVIVAKNGKILGASIVGTQAGEIIQMWALAISQNMKIKAMRGFISPYPTLAEINKRAATTYFAKLPSNTVVRKIIKALAFFG